MKESIQLDFPLEINGETIKTIEYDPADFKAKHHLQAAGARKYTPVTATPNPMTDTELQFNIAVQAILASNKDKGWSAEDFERLSGSDPFKFHMVGMSFFGVKPEEQQPGSSEGLSDDIPSDSMLPGSIS